MARNSIWDDVSRADIVAAIKKFIREKPEYPEPRNTFLMYNGEMLPAKHIRGMAYENHFGREICKKKFNGGKETVKFGQTVDLW